MITPTRHTIKDFDYHSAPWGIEYLSTYAIEELDRIFDFIEEHGDEFRFCQSCLMSKEDLTGGEIAIIMRMGSQNQIIIDLIDVDAGDYQEHITYPLVKGHVTSPIIEKRKT